VASTTLSNNSIMHTPKDGAASTGPGGACDPKAFDASGHDAVPETTTVTVLFTDVVGSVGMRQREGDTAAHEIMTRHNEIVRREIAGHAGEEVKTIGDSFMIAFDSARKAVECAIAVPALAP
jgi:class 3 adenylate cyclase